MKIMYDLGTTCSSESQSQSTDPVTGFPPNCDHLVHFSHLFESHFKFILTCHIFRMVLGLYLEDAMGIPPRFSRTLVQHLCLSQSQYALFSWCPHSSLPRPVTGLWSWTCRQVCIPCVGPYPVIAVQHGPTEREETLCKYTHIYTCIDLVYTLMKLCIVNMKYRFIRASCIMWGFSGVSVSK